VEGFQNEGICAELLERSWRASDDLGLYAAAEQKPANGRRCAVAEAEGARPALVLSMGIGTQSEDVTIGVLDW
jgi:hypothetical protein